MRRNLDPTTVTIIARGLHAATEEMGANLVRSAFSTVVREARGCSTALLDEQGNIVAQADMIPIQTAALGISFKESMATLGLAHASNATSRTNELPWCTPSRPMVIIRTVAAAPP